MFVINLIKSEKSKRTCEHETKNQFHQHFASSVFPNSLLPKKLQTQTAKAVKNTFVQKKNVGEINPKIQFN